MDVDVGNFVDPAPDASPVPVLRRAMRRELNANYLKRGEPQDQPILCNSTTYYLNYTGLKQITVGLRSDENFDVKIVISHLKVPSRHVELSKQDYATFTQHFDAISQYLQLGPNSRTSKKVQLSDVDVLCENMYNKPTVTLFDRRNGASVSFQRNVLDCLIWLRDNVAAAIKAGEALQQQLLVANFDSINHESDVRLQQVLTELRTYNCLSWL